MLCVSALWLNAKAGCTFKVWKPNKSTRRFMYTKEDLEDKLHVPLFHKFTFNFLQEKYSYYVIVNRFKILQHRSDVTVKHTTRVGAMDDFSNQHDEYQKGVFIHKINTKAKSELYVHCKNEKHSRQISQIKHWRKMLHHHMNGVEEASKPPNLYLKNCPTHCIGL